MDEEECARWAGMNDTITQDNNLFDPVGGKGAPNPEMPESDKTFLHFEQIRQLSAVLHFRYILLLEMRRSFDNQSP